jgi:predicted nucleotidyltransferase
MAARTYEQRAHIALTRATDALIDFLYLTQEPRVQCQNRYVTNQLNIVLDEIEGIRKKVRQGRWTWISHK